MELLIIVAIIIIILMVIASKKHPATPRGLAGLVAVKCPSCRTPIDRKASHCPFCGQATGFGHVPVRAWAEAPYPAKRREPMTAGRAIAYVILILCVVFSVIVVFASARAEEQTRFYDARGNSIGTAAPQGQGSVRYYDSRGNSLGTSTTNSTGTTTFYGPGGNVTGRASGPGPAFRDGRGK